jgi:hypothetical protein
MWAILLDSEHYEVETLTVAVRTHCMICVRHIQWEQVMLHWMFHKMQCYWTSDQQAILLYTVFTHNHFQRKYLCECPHKQCNRIWSQVHSPPTAARIKNERTYTSVLSIHLHGIGRENFDLPFLESGHYRFTLKTIKHIPECTKTFHVIIQTDVTAIF